MKYTFRRDKSVELDGVFIGYLTRTRAGYWIETPKGRSGEVFVSRDTAAGVLADRTAREES